MIADVPARELEVVRFATERPELKPVSWEASGEHLVATWRAELERVGKAFTGRTIADVPRTASEARALLVHNEFNVEGADDAQVLRFAHRLTWLRCALSLVDAGFSVRNRPGEPLRFQRGAEVADPGESISRLQGDEGSVEAWRAEWEPLGLANVPFA